MFQNWSDNLLKPRHGEYFCFPQSDKAIYKSMEVVSLDVSKNRQWQKMTESFLENKVFGAVNFLAEKFSLHKFFHPVIGACLSEESFIDWSPNAFATDRDVRFYEMEYGVAAIDGQACLKEIITLTKKESAPTLFPIEVRHTKGDPLWLS